SGAKRILRSTLACMRSTAFECVQLGCVCVPSMRSHALPANGYSTFKNNTIMCIYMAHLPTFDVFPGHVLAGFYDLEQCETLLESHKGMDFNCYIS
ncbi:uncharacterized protein EV420DRAFT_1582071, partial [Desarmillaria tabescens]